MAKETYFSWLRNPGGWMAKKRLALVLGGGGGRGAMQVGAIRALIEADYKPDLLVGTSIGAMTATGLALWGVNLAGISAMEQTWKDAADACLLDPRLMRLLLRRILRWPDSFANHRVLQFLESRGITRDLRFGQITGVQLGLIGADLISGQPVIYGQDPDQSIVDGLLASIALPPWFAPVEKDGHSIVDGGFLSNLPIEPALTMGATEIIALDLDDSENLEEKWNDTFTQYLITFSNAINRRHVALETALAEARGVPVHYIQLKSPTPTPLWDFSNYQQLIQTGYEITSQEIPRWDRPGRAPQLSRN